MVVPFGTAMVLRLELRETALRGNHAAVVLRRRRGEARRQGRAVAGSDRFLVALENGGGMLEHARLLGRLSCVHDRRDSVPTGIELVLDVVDEGVDLGLDRARVAGRETRRAGTERARPTGTLGVVRTYRSVVGTAAAHV